MKTLEQILSKSEYWKKTLKSDNFELVQSEVTEYSCFIRELLKYRRISEFSGSEIDLLKRLQANVDAIQAQMLVAKEAVAEKISRLQEGRRMNNIYQAHQ